MALKPIRRPVGHSLKPVGKKPAAKPSLKPKPSSTGFGGESASRAKVKPGGSFARAQTEFVKYEEKRNQPFRKSVPVGQSSEVYFLDSGEPWYRFEHNIGGGPNSRGDTFPCIKDSDENCPACSKENKEGAYVMFLTCVTPKDTWTDKKSGETKTARWRKQLFPIKIKMAKKYQRLFEAHGTFRGMVVKIHRDNKMDAGTGSDVEFVRMMTEAEIQKYAKEMPGVKNQKDRDLIKKSDITKPFDYDKVMPMPDAKKLAAMIGSKSRSMGEADFDGDDSGDGFDGATGWGSDDDE